jgi:hypothetical protein
VRLGPLEIANLHRTFLLGVDVQEVKWESRLGRIVIDRVDVEARFREALKGRYERFAVVGVHVRLLPPGAPVLKKTTA